MHDEHKIPLLIISTTLSALAYERALFMIFLLVWNIIDVTEWMWIEWFKFEGITTPIPYAKFTFTTSPSTKVENTRLNPTIFPRINCKM